MGVSVPNTRAMPAAVFAGLDELVPNPLNPRVHGEDVDRLARTIIRTRWGAPILAQKATRRVIGGHGRLEAARKIMAGIVVDGLLRGGPDHLLDRDAPGPGMVPVRWLDVSDAEADALTLADNAPALHGVDDAALIVSMATRSFERDASIMRDIGYGSETLDALVREAGAAVLADANSTADDFIDAADMPSVSAEADANADSKPGSVYQLGPHRLVCGDSRDAAVWDQLMLDDAADLVWTDPPYGVNICGGSKDARNKRFASGDRIENDDLSHDELQEFLQLVLGHAFAATKPGGAWYVAAPAEPLFHAFGSVLLRLSVWRHTIMWCKQHFVFGRCDYHYRHEPIFYGWKDGAAHFFVDDRTQDSVLTFDRPSRSPDHPTMKPIALVKRMVENSSRPNEIVCDPFGGSGTTLLACAETGRRARLIELAPRYCDAIRKRWTTYAKARGIDPGAGALDG